jgi:hypothetical protein
MAVAAANGDGQTPHDYDVERIGNLALAKKRRAAGHAQPLEPGFEVGEQGRIKLAQQRHRRQSPRQRRSLEGCAVVHGARSTRIIDRLIVESILCEREVNCSAGGAFDAAGGATRDSCAQRFPTAATKLRPQPRTSRTAWHAMPRRGLALRRESRGHAVRHTDPESNGQADGADAPSINSRSPPPSFRSSATRSLGKSGRGRSTSEEGRGDINSRHAESRFRACRRILAAPRRLCR